MEMQSWRSPAAPAYPFPRNLLVQLMYPVFQVSSGSLSLLSHSRVTLDVVSNFFFSFSREKKNTHLEERYEPFTVR